MLFFFKNGVAPMMIRALPGFAYELLLIFPGGFVYCVRHLRMLALFG